jgi:adenylylsulfate kinase-like enzyme
MGELRQFTGISYPNEPPLQAKILVATDTLNVHQSVELLLNYLERNAFSYRKVRFID